MPLTPEQYRVETLRNQAAFPDSYIACARCSWLRQIPGHQDDRCALCASTGKVSKGTVRFQWGKP